MVRDAQVRLLRRKLIEGETQESAAAAAGISERSARPVEKRLVPISRRKPHTWRTREDPFVEVCDAEMLPLLEADKRGVLEATTILAELQRRHPGDFIHGQLLTLQRRLRQ